MCSALAILLRIRIYVLVTNDKQTTSCGSCIVRAILISLPSDGSGVFVLFPVTTKMSLINPIQRLLTAIKHAFLVAN